MQGFIFRITQSILVVNHRWCEVALSGFVISCINFCLHLWASQVLIYSLQVIHNMPCAPFTYFVLMYECHLLNNASALLVLPMHAAIYCYYKLIPCVECLWYVKFWHLCLKQEYQLIEWISKGQTIALNINIVFGTIDLCLDSDHLHCEKNWTHMLSTSGSYSRLADKIGIIFKFLYKLNYSDFYFVY